MTKADADSPPLPVEDILDVVRLLPDVLFRCHKESDGKIYWSLNEGGLAEQFGLTTNEIKGKSLENLFPGGASDELQQHFEDAFNGKITIFTNEIEGRHFRHYPQPIFDEEGNITEVVGFIAEVTELVETQQALEAANKELEAFTYTASHDFRGPLSTMRIDASTLMQKLPADSKEHRSARRIKNSAERLAGMVDGLLELSRASQKTIDLRLVSITGVAQMVAAELTRRDPQRVIEWNIADGMDVTADPRLVDVLIQNLLENAWKFSADEDVTRIWIQPTDDGMIEVRDNGPGFESDAETDIFQAFTRLGHGTTGSGIGLATVKRIIDRHGGHIEVEGNPGQGAVFRFRLDAAEEP